MRVFNRGSDSIEVALRKNRPEARAELVADLTARVSAAPSQTYAGSRLAFAAALAVLVVGTFLSFGGAAYAAGNAPQKPAAPASTSAAADEYGSQQVATVPSTPPTSNVAGQTASTPPTQSGSLPFTGIGLGSTALVSLLLVSLGVYLRRRESRE